MFLLIVTCTLYQLLKHNVEKEVYRVWTTVYYSAAEGRVQAAYSPSIDTTHGLPHR